MSCLAYLILILTFRLEANEVLDEEIDINKRVIGGYRAHPNQFPYAISLKGGFPQTLRSTYCGSSIIAERYLLTAAHCFGSKTENGDTMRNPQYWTIQAGSTVIDLRYDFRNRLSVAGVNLVSGEGRKETSGFNALLKVLGTFLKHVTNYVSKPIYRLTSNSNDGIEIEKIIVHPDYVEGHLEYDIAIVKLSGKLTLGKYPLLLKAKLPDGDDISSLPATNDECVLVGWGCTEKGSGPSRYAMYSKFKVYENEECSEIYSHAAGLNKDHEFCAGYHKEHIGICPGDSGSGLVCPAGDQWELMGVASATHAKDPANFPGLFSRVAYFRDWIIETQKENDPPNPNLFTFL